MMKWNYTPHTKAQNKIKNVKRKQQKLTRPTISTRNSVFPDRNESVDWSHNKWPELVLHRVKCIQRNQLMPHQRLLCRASVPGPMFQPPIYLSSGLCKPELSPFYDVAWWTMMNEMRKKMQVGGNSMSIQNNVKWKFFQVFKAFSRLFQVFESSKCHVSVFQMKRRLSSRLSFENMSKMQRHVCVLLVEPTTRDYHYSELVSYHACC